MNPQRATARGHGAASRPFAARCLRILGAGLVLLLGAAWAPQAWATCMVQCKGELVGKDCQPSETLEVGKPLNFAVSCETCCSPPGGPATCNASEVGTSQLGIYDSAGAQLAGSFEPSSLSCKKSLAFKPAAGELGPGTYELRYTNMILLKFTLTAPGSCASSADCPPCSACVGGSCKGMGVVVCSKDADCPQSQQCQVDPVAPCNNACVPGPGPDVVDADDGAGDNWYCDTSSSDPGYGDAVSSDTGVGSDAGPADIQRSPGDALDAGGVADAVADSGGVADAGGAADTGGVADAGGKPLPPPDSAPVQSGCRAAPAQADGYPGAIAIACGVAFVLLRRRVRC